MSNDDDLLNNYTRVRVDADEQVVEVADIAWDGPCNPVLSWVETRRLPATASAAEVERTRRQLLQLPQFFVICEECSKRKVSGHTSNGVCHSCMERNHHAVF